MPSAPKIRGQIRCRNQRLKRLSTTGIPALEDMQDATDHAPIFDMPGWFIGKYGSMAAQTKEVSHTPVGRLSDIVLIFDTV